MLMSNSSKYDDGIMRARKSKTTVKHDTSVICRAIFTRQTADICMTAEVSDLLCQVLLASPASTLVQCANDEYIDNLQTRNWY